MSRCTGKKINAKYESFQLNGLASAEHTAYRCHCKPTRVGSFTGFYPVTIRCEII